MPRSLKALYNLSQPSGANPSLNFSIVSSVSPRFFKYSNPALPYDVLSKQL